MTDPAPPPSSGASVSGTANGTERRLTWSEAVTACRDRGAAHVLATVLGVAGSAPREAGAKMVVTAEDTFDTIGGGRLELRVIERARELLGWEPKRGLEDTLRATIADLVATHQSERMPLEASSGG